LTGPGAKLKTFVSFIGPTTDELCFISSSGRPEYVNRIIYGIEANQVPEGCEHSRRNSCWAECLADLFITSLMAPNATLPIMVEHPYHFRLLVAKMYLPYARLSTPRKMKYPTSR